MGPPGNAGARTGDPGAAVVHRRSSAANDSSDSKKPELSFLKLRFADAILQHDVETAAKLLPQADAALNGPQP